MPRGHNLFRHHLTCALAALLLLALPALASTPDATPLAVAGSFPSAGTDLIEHDLQVEIYQSTDSGEQLLETLLFEGRMLLDRGVPYVNADGLRQIDFVVTSWEAIAWSNLLGGDVIYRLSTTPQKTSTIIAEQPTSDFPATFTFNVIFDAFVDGVLVHPGHHGRPWQHGFLEVPPSGDRRFSPTITGFEDTVITAEHPEHGLLVFRPKDCNDRESRTLGLDATTSR